MTDENDNGEKSKHGCDMEHHNAETAILLERCTRKPRYHSGLPGTGHGQGQAQYINKYM